MSGIKQKAAALFCALCLCLGMLGAADGGDGWVLHRALAALSQDPVALMDLSKITVSTSGAHCAVSGFAWYDSSGSAVTSGVFLWGETYRLEVTLEAVDGYSFAEDAAGYINNSECGLSRDPAGGFVTLWRDYVPVAWAPSIYFHPKDAKVEEGKYASFWVSGDYVADYDWYLKSPDGEKLKLEDLETKFPGAVVTENHQSSLTISRIPAEMDGWSVVCTFVSAGNITRKDSNPAKITVTGAASPSPEPTPEVTPEPTPEATPEPTPEPTPEEPAETEPEAAEPQQEHEHSFSDQWSYDSSFHWHECECGQRQDELAHRFIKTDSEGRSICSVCGYTAVDTEEEPESQPAPEMTEEMLSRVAVLRWTLLAIAAVTVLGVALILVQSARDRVRRRRRRR